MVRDLRLFLKGDYVGTGMTPFFFKGLPFRQPKILSPTNTTIRRPANENRPKKPFLP